MVKRKGEEMLDNIKRREEERLGDVKGKERCGSGALLANGHSKRCADEGV